MFHMAGDVKLNVEKIEANKGFKAKLVDNV